MNWAFGPVTEQEILALSAKGFLYKEIGDRLGITYTTVRTHLHVIYDKPHVRSRTEAAVKFLNRSIFGAYRAPHFIRVSLRHSAACALLLIS